MRSVREPRTAAAGALLVAAGAYVLLQPWGPPGECARGLIGGWTGIGMCLMAAAVPTVTGMAVGLVLVTIGLWYLFRAQLPASVANPALATILFAIVLWSVYVLATSPTGPGRSFPPARETAAPQIRVP